MKTKPNILIIDDDKDFSKALSLFFQVQKTGDRLVSFENAEDALDSLVQNQYDMIICDYWLPGMNGLEFFKQIQDMQTHARKVLITGSGTSESPVKEALGVIIDGIIPKPLNMEDLEGLAAGRRIKKEEALFEIQKKPGGKDAPYRVITHHVAGSMGVGLIPIPLVDLMALTFVQLNMIKKLAKIYNIPFSKDRGKHLIGSLAGGTLPVVSAGPVSSIIKTVPIVGQTVGVIAMSILAGASTYAVGRVFDQHFASGGTFLNLNPNEVRAYYAEMFREGQKVASRFKKKDKKFELAQNSA
jgi:uncharacterized protein (DUF697 family)/ActR/RegA family two-component response regulator